VAVLVVIALYLACGLVFATWFVGGGVGRIDRLAAAARWWVRAVWAPGVVGMWPVLLWIVVRGKERGS
jgi:hypothetical protein